MLNVNPLKKLYFLLLLMSIDSFAQNSNFSPFDPAHWGVVQHNSEMNKVKLLKDIVYLKNDKSELHINIYKPPAVRRDEKLPAVVFLNVAAVTPGRPAVNTFEGHISWPRLVATHGFIGISIEVGDKVEEAFDSLFSFLKKNGNKFNIDAQRLGVWAASANTIVSGNYLMKPNLYEGIKAAVLYYGFFPTVPINKSLPVLFVVAEGDAAQNQYETIWNEILKSKAPWTVKMASNLPHAFDLFTNSDDSRIVINETISFWKNHLMYTPPSLPKNEIEREVMSAMYWHDDQKVTQLMETWFQNNGDSKDQLAYSLYARSLLNTGNYSHAEQVYKKQLQTDSSNRNTLLDLAIASYADDRPETAESYLSVFKKKAELQRPNLIYMATALRQLKKFRYSAEYYEKALAIEARPFTYYLIGVCYTLLDEREKAFEALSNAIDRGYGSKQQYENDADLASLRTDPRWQALLKRMEAMFEGKTPFKRAHHEMVYDETQKSVLLIGGSTPINGGQWYKFFNDIWQFTSAGWRKVGDAGDERSGIRLAFNSKENRLYSFGGFTSNNQSSGQLRMLQDGTWKILTDFPTMKAAEPGFVYDASRNKLVAFGGTAARGIVNSTTWEWDGRTWISAEAKGPTGRQAFAMVFDSKRNKTVLFGGMDGAGKVLEDGVWEYDGVVWKNYLPAVGPGPRMLPGFTYDSKRGMLLIFGGADKNGVKGDTWGWDGSAWSKLADAGPSPRIMGYMAYDKNRDRSVLFGGRLGASGDAFDTWEWDGTNWKEIK